MTAPVALTTNPTLPLLGKRALVTGGGRGIGAAIAWKLAELGANVAITYSASSQKAEALALKIRESGRKSIAIQADAADAVAVREAVNRTVNHMGGLDILVNNAGVATMGAFVDQPLEEIDSLIDVNIRGVFMTTQAALKHMSDGGRIITIGSNVGLQVPFAGISVYAATKAALESFTRGLARELGERQITVNLVRPGPTNTDMNPADGDLASMIINTIPVKRYGHPEEIAKAVAFLASPDAAFITGTGITADGGSIA